MEIAKHMASNVAPDQPAPPKEYAAENASLPERARFRGVRKVDTPLAGESQPRELGGVLNQSNFPEAAPKRWDDKLFETRLKANQVEQVKFTFLQLGSIC